MKKTQKPAAKRQRETDLVQTTPSKKPKLSEEPVAAPETLPVLFHKIQYNEFYKVHGVKRIAFNNDESLCAVSRTSSEIEIWSTNTHSWVPVAVCNACYFTRRIENSCSCQYNSGIADVGGW